MLLFVEFPVFRSISSLLALTFALIGVACTNPAQFSGTSGARNVNSTPYPDETCKEEYDCTPPCDPEIEECDTTPDETDPEPTPYPDEDSQPNPNPDEDSQPNPYPDEEPLPNPNPDEDPQPNPYPDDETKRPKLRQRSLSIRHRAVKYPYHDQRRRTVWSGSKRG